MAPKEIKQLSNAAVVDLKAELFKSREQFERSRSSGGATSMQGGGSNESIKEFKRLSDANKLRIKEMNERRLHRNKNYSHSASKPTPKEDEPNDDTALAASWVALQRKTAEYDRRANAKNLDSDDDEPDSSKRRKATAAGEDALPLVDFVRKHQAEGSSATKERRDESLSADVDEDPWIETTDSFGRTRIVRKSEAAKLKQMGPSFVSAGESAETGDYDNNNSRDLESQDMRREQERQEWERQAMSEIFGDSSGKKDPLPPPKHYDPNREIRNLGVGFYGFSQEDEERKQQMSALQDIRKDTLGAQSKAVLLKESRKEKLEERKALLRERRKRKGASSKGDDAAGGAGDDEDGDVDSFLKGLLPILHPLSKTKNKLHKLDPANMKSMKLLACVLMVPTLTFAAAAFDPSLLPENTPGTNQLNATSILLLKLEKSRARVSRNHATLPDDETSDTTKGGLKPHLRFESIKKRSDMHSLPQVLGFSRQQHRGKSLAGLLSLGPSEWHDCLYWMLMSMWLVFGLAIALAVTMDT
ncbi:hypothetical protein CcCBS67573_g03011 [Chytriomyces confervae]|uniref:Uncharacterized protein n=1 Tax=Chytriomyces confervae TaxID=246404 RepID=A0A507FHF0_9FUNG|nr:hypothetical protein CcCBS67573_g03011 [Chytriomyces confervae]